jgi:hypothetical protein
MIMIMIIFTFVVEARLGQTLAVSPREGEGDYGGLATAGPAVPCPPWALQRLARTDSPWHLIWPPISDMRGGWVAFASRNVHQTVASVLRSSLFSYEQQHVRYSP